MPLKKRSTLEALKWDHIDVGTVLFLMGEDGLEPEEWTAEEKCAVVSAVVNTIEVATEPQHIDIANAFGAIREAELQYQEKRSATPTPPPGNPTLTTRINLRAALEARFLVDGKLQSQQLLPDACELLLVEACLEHAVFESLTEAQAIHDLLLESLRASNESTDQCDLENLGRCLALVAKQVGVLSVTRPNT
jgi:hypothetical protein